MSEKEKPRRECPRGFTLVLQEGGALFAVRLNKEFEGHFVSD